MARYIILGDIHGCREYIDAVSPFIENLLWRSNFDGVLIPGDIGGYGPDSKYCYLRIIELKKRLETSGKVCKIAKGNHEDDLELRFTSPEIPATKEGGSETEEIGLLLTIADLCGKEVCHQSESGEWIFNPKALRGMLVEDWNSRLKKGDKDIIVPTYLQDLRKRTGERIKSRIVPVSGGFWRKDIAASTLDSVVDQSFNYLNEYKFVIEQEERMKVLPEILYFIANLQEEERAGDIKIKHTVRRKEDGKSLYVVGESQLGYLNKVMQKSKGHPLESSRYVVSDQVLNSDVFNDCNVLILGHLHDSNTYKKGNKKIIMANSPFPRDGKGIRGTITTYDSVKGTIKNEDIYYDFEATKKKLEKLNPRFLRQVELYRSVPRK